MNRRDYIMALRRELERMPFDERETAIGYYEEYFEEAGPENEVQVIQQLGSPQEVAAQVMSDYMEKDIQKPTKTPKQGLGKVWMVVLAIFASPIALPLALAAVIMAFAFVIVILALIIAFFACGIAFVVSGIAIIVVGLSVVFQSGLTALFYAGCGIALVGLGILFTFSTVALGGKVLGSIARGLSRFLKKRLGKNKNNTGVPVQ